MCRAPFWLSLLATFCACDDGGASPADPVPDAFVGDASVELDVAVDAAEIAPDAAPDARADFGPHTPPTPFTDNLHLSERVLAIAHRGGRRFAPEETMPAFRHAAELGVDVLELDLHTTSDGVVVCQHDSDVDRTTDGAGPIHEMTFEQARQLDAGYRFTTDGGATFPYRGAGVQIPTLREVIDAFPDHHYAIEIKQSDPPIIDEVVAVLRETGADARVSVAAFADPVVRAVRAAAPDLVTALALGEIVGFTLLNDDTERDYRAPGHLLQIPRRQGNLEVLTPELVARAHRLGVKVQVWTVNDPGEMREVLEMGVDGVMTDDPERLLEEMERR